MLGQAIQDLKDTARQILTKNNVQGVMCIDKDGFSLVCLGTAKDKHAGYLSSIVGLSHKLGNSDSPVISIDCEASNILLQEKDDIIIAIYK